MGGIYGFEKGNQVKWSIDENDFETLKLKKVV